MTSTPIPAPAVMVLSLLRADVPQPHGRPEAWPRWGALASAKYHERAEYHLGHARAFTEVLVRLGALPADTELPRRRREHYAKYRGLSQQRLHWLWTGLHLTIARYGLALAATVTVRAA